EIFHATVFKLGVEFIDRDTKSFFERVMPGSTSGSSAEKFQHILLAAKILGEKLGAQKSERVFTACTSSVRARARFNRLKRRTDFLYCIHATLACGSIILDFFARHNPLRQIIRAAFN